MTEVVKILRAFRPGDVVFLQTDWPISDETAQRIKAAAESSLEGTGVKVVVLGHGLNVAAAEETLETSHLESPQ
jgi:hypothetical protein